MRKSPMQEALELARYQLKDKYRYCTHKFYQQLVLFGLPNPMTCRYCGRHKV